MPELPEVEHLRRSLEPALVGTRVADVAVRRRGVVTVSGAARRGSRLDRALLVGATIEATARHGKQMALLAADGRALVVQLGMTGSVTIEDGTPPRGVLARHRHVVWRLEPARRLAFRDPRRFGGLTAFASLEALRASWAELGPDALDTPPPDLAEHLARTLARRRRPVKSALLDQAIVAGLGNIYVDEALFAARIHPLREAGDIADGSWSALAVEIQRILSHAANQGGSTLRDYRDAFGRPGTAVQTHRVYGRAGQRCDRCGTPIESVRLQGRTTAFCPCCQDLST